MNQGEWLEKFNLHLADPESRDRPKLCWVDLETTGLSHEVDVILEFGMVLTDEWGNVVPDSMYSSAIYEPNNNYMERIANMDTVVLNMHHRSGLMNELTEKNTVNLKEAVYHAVGIMAYHNVTDESVYLAGSSVHFDAGFIERDMPDFDKVLHYRQVNVSTLKVLCQQLSPVLYGDIEKTLKPIKAHRSMSDLGDSINEYRAYVENFLYV